MHPYRLALGTGNITLARGIGALILRLLNETEPNTVRHRALARRLLELRRKNAPSFTIECGCYQGDGHGDGFVRDTKMGNEIFPRAAQKNALMLVAAMKMCWSEEHPNEPFPRTERNSPAPATL
jgi:hypothetical protein